jgi:hypothetical protein
MSACQAVFDPGIALACCAGMPKKKTPRTLGIVPRTLLRGAIAGAIPACALTGCTNDKIAIDGSAQVPDGGFAGVADQAFFSVDAPAFLPPDGGFDGVAAPFDTAADARDGGADARDGGDAAKDAYEWSVADLGFHEDKPPPDAAPEVNFFAVDAASFKG